MAATQPLVGEGNDVSLLQLGRLRRPSAAAAPPPQATVVKPLLSGHGYEGATLCMPRCLRLDGPTILFWGLGSALGFRNLDL